MISSPSHMVRLTSYHVFPQHTTFWCTEVEEHGHSLCPQFKCTTDPKMHMIHRWHEADTIGHLKVPTRTFLVLHSCILRLKGRYWTDCFFKKDEKWYYAGRYVGLHLASLTAREWDALAKEVAPPQLFVIWNIDGVLSRSNRPYSRNVLPIVVTYLRKSSTKRGQLHHVGALRVSCIGLQCVGFDSALYQVIMEQAKKAQATGNWAGPWVTSVEGLGLAE